MTAIFDRDDQALGGFLRTHRNYLGLSIHELSQKTGIEPVRLVSLEDGYAYPAIYAREAFVISKALGIDYVSVLRKAKGEA